MLTYTDPDWIWHLLDEDDCEEGQDLEPEKPVNSLRPAMEESLARVAEALGEYGADIERTENGLSFPGRMGRTHIVAFPQNYLCNDGQQVLDTVRIVTEPEPALTISPAVVACANQAPGLSAVERSLTSKRLTAYSRVSNFAGWDGNLPLHESVIVAAALSHDTVLATAMNEALGLAGEKAWPGVQLPGSGEPCRWGRADMLEVCEALKLEKDLADGEVPELSVAIPWIGDVEALRNAKGAFRLRFLLDRSHPMLGGGLFVRLELPVFRYRRYLAWVANWLNGVELCAKDAPPFFGAWSVAPDRDQLVFTTFWPNMLYQPGLALNITAWALYRSRRARNWLEDELQRGDGSGEAFGIVEPDDRA